MDGPDIERRNVDSKDFRLLVALHRNARQSYQSLGRGTSLSAPAVRDRLKRLESGGVLNGYGLWMDPIVFGRKEVLTFFQRERSKSDVVNVLATPDVAWVGWKLDGGLTVGLWSLNPDESVGRLASFLGEKPTGRTTSVASWHRDSPPSYLDWMVIDALIDDPRRPFESLVDSTGLSPKTVRKHLKRVFESGLAMAMPRQGAVEGSGELVYHLAVGGDATESEIRAVIQDAMLLHQTGRPPMKYLLCRGTDLGEVTTSTNALRRLPSVKSATVTLNRDLLFALEFEHSLVRERMRTLDRQRNRNQTT